MKIFLGIIFILIIICAASWICDTHRFVIRHYELDSEKITRDARFVLLADLHNREYGRDNEKLVSAIRSLHPDGILIGGDLLNGIAGSDFGPAVRITEQLCGDYPIYYGMGNHEYRLKLYPENYGSMWTDYTSELDRLGVHVMDNERAYIPELNVDIAALSIGKEYYRRFKYIPLTGEKTEEYIGPAADDRYQILIAHDPEYFRAYSEWGADLTVSGHVHGGIMRLPFIGGIVSPRIIRFPRYSGGKYRKNGRVMVVSCGLGTHTLHVRIFNPAELSVIDIHKKQ